MMNFNIGLLRWALYRVRKQYQKYTLKIEQQKIKRSILGEEFDYIMSTVDIPKLDKDKEIVKSEKPVKNEE